MEKLNASKRIVEFDLLRGLSALLIVLYHYTTRYNDIFGHIKPYPVNVWFGSMGVCVFFSLSGFLIAAHTQNTLGFSGALKFALKRMIRLYPSYWCCIILTSCVAALLLPVKLLSISDILVNFTMLQSFLGVKSVDGAYWTLQIEILFYAVIGLLILLRQMKNIRILALIWIISSVFLNLFEMYVSDTKIVHFFQLLFITKYFHMFGLGIFFCHLSTAVSKKQMIISIAGLLLCLVSHFILYNISYNIFYWILLGIYLFILWNRRFSKHPFRFESIRWLKPVYFISGISYPLYLVHQYVGYAIIQKLEGVGLTSEFMLLIPITVSILLAWLIHKFVEKPAIKFFNHRLETLK